MEIFDLFYEIYEEENNGTMMSNDRTEPDKFAAIDIPFGDLEIVRSDKRKVYRYMSNKEFALFEFGKTVRGNLHTDVRSSTINRENVCFIQGKTAFDNHGEECIYSPEMCHSFLEGVVTDDILVEFETDVPFVKGYGIYSNPITDLWIDCIVIEELYVASYNNKTFKALRYMIPGSKQWNDYNESTALEAALTESI